jgi:hypothetical protein
MKIRSALATLALSALASCVSTDLASQVAPDFRGHAFARTLVVADLGSLQARMTAEDRIVSELSDARASVLRSLDVVFAADTLPVEEFLNKAAAEGADGVLVLRILKEGEDRSYVPAHGHMTITSSGSGGVVHGSAYTYGGGTVREPWADYEAKLYETATGKVAWYATARTEGPGGANARDLARSFASEVVRALLHKGLVQLERRK